MVPVSALGRQGVYHLDVTDNPSINPSVWSQPSTLEHQQRLAVVILVPQVALGVGVGVECW